MAVTAVVFAQAPGRIVADTKLDLVVDPVGQMARALHLWDPTAAFGHVPNQAAGYLFPMGPFFALARALSIPAWVTQRLWLSILLIVALTGTVRLARALDIGSEPTRVVAGLAYALAPGAAALSGTSAHLLPVALLPWAIVPLTRTDTARRLTARSALAVALMGGVNGAAVAAVLPAPALFIATRPARRSPRARLFVWWVGCIVLATGWWLGALWFQSRYGFDFLPFTESAAVTTAATSATEVLRGGGSWLAFLNLNGPWAQGAWTTAALPAAVAASAVLAATGLAGLARRDCPERRFLISTLVVGFALMTAGYAGSLGSPVSQPVRDLLDGPLAGVRNVGKAFPLVRLPVVLGVAHLLAGVRWRRGPGVRWAASAAVLATLVASAAPFARGELYPSGSFEALPAHWRDAAAWLDEHAPGRGRALVVPGSPFGEYAWGRPLDEPLQPLARSPWAVRDLIPLGSAGEIRALDAVEAVLEGGVGSATLAGGLRRMGVSYLVVRNDLDWRRHQDPRPLQVRRVLAASPGIRRVTRFGPTVGAFDAGPGGDVELRRLERGLHAVEIYALDPARAAVPSGEQAPGRVSTVPAYGPVVVSGGPETVVALAGQGVLDGRLAVLADDPAAAAGNPATVVVTDSLQRRDVDFGLLRNNASYVLEPGEPSPHTGEAPADYPVPGASRSRLVVDGGHVAASSYGTIIQRLPQYGPAAAFDGLASTAWVSGAGDGDEGEWIELRLDDRRAVAEVAIQPLADGPFRPTVREVVVTTEGGSIRSPLGEGEARVVVPALAAPTNFVRVTLATVDDRADRLSTAGAGLREVEVPGVDYERTVVVPPGRVPGESRRVLVFSSPVDRSALLLGELADEEPVMGRRFTLDGAGSFDLNGEAVVVPGEARDQLLAALRPSPRNPNPAVTVPCGEGPTLSIDGRSVETQLAGRRADVAGYRPLSLRPCPRGPLALAEGSHAVAAPTHPLATVTGLSLSEPAALGPPSPARTAATVRWGRVARAVDLGPGPETVLVVHENFNPGWTARFSGQELEPVRVDGWQQGWRVPAGEAGRVVLHFAPDRPYRWALLLGAVTALALVPLSLRRRRTPTLLGAEVARRGAPSAPKTVGVLPWVAAGAMVVAGMIAAAGAGAHPGSGSGTFSGPAQAAALVALAAVVASLARPRRPEFARLVAARIRNVGGSVNPGPARGRRERGGNGRVSRHVRAPRIVPNPDWSGPGGAW